MQLPKDVISPRHKLDVMLVSLGEKPATWQDIDSFRQHGTAYADKSFIRRVKDMRNLLQRIELPYYELLDRYSGSFFIGQTPEFAQRLHHAYTMSPSPERDRLFGEAVGFPQTAVAAFERMERGNKRALMRQEELPEEITTREEMAFLNFMLSRDHWGEELRAIRNQIDILKKRAPRLYDSWKREP